MDGLGVAGDDPRALHLLRTLFLLLLHQLHLRLPGTRSRRLGAPAQRTQDSSTLLGGLHPLYCITPSWALEQFFFLTCEHVTSHQQQLNAFTCTWLPRIPQIPGCSSSLYGDVSKGPQKATSVPVLCVFKHPERADTRPGFNEKCVDWTEFTSTFSEQSLRNLPPSRQLLAGKQCSLTICIVALKWQMFKTGKKERIWAFAEDKMPLKSQDFRVFYSSPHLSNKPGHQTRQRCHPSNSHPKVCVPLCLHKSSQDQSSRPNSPDTSSERLLWQPNLLRW